MVAPGRAVQTFLCAVAVTLVAVMLVFPSAPAGLPAPASEGFSAAAPVGGSAPSAPITDRDAARAKIYAAYGRLPLSFEANQGQTDARVDFLARGSAYTLFLAGGDAVLALRSPEAAPPSRSGNEAQRLSAALPAESGSPDTVLRLQLAGASPEPAPAGLAALPGKANYFLGNDPAQWRTNIPTYARVQYADVYPGVDLLYYGSQEQLEYDFVVAPGADPDAIALTFEGADAIEVDAAGDLVLRLAGGELRQRKPVVYQELDGVQQTIPGGYVLRPHGADAACCAAVGFEVGAYDASRPLLIDPVLTYSTYLGGSNGDIGAGIAVDSGGNAYVTGLTRSPDFPITAGAFDTTCGTDGQCNGGTTSDGFVTKLNPQGSALVYSTYLGGSLNDQGFGIVVDTGGNAYVTGSTSSLNFPTTVGAYQTAYLGGGSNAFVTKLNPSGSALVYSTFLVGSVSSAAGLSIAIDTGLNAYTAGFIDSAVVFTKLNSAGSALVYGATITGNGQQAANGIVVDSGGNAYLTGTTSSTNFPVVNPFQMTSGGGQDAFVAKVNPAGTSLIYSTYLGGSGQDQGTDIAIDSAGNAYVTGQTCSTNFPTLNPIQAANLGSCDAFVTKLNTAGSALIYSTYLGGSGNDGGQSIAVDAATNTYVTGQTCSTNFPTLNPIQAANLGGCDAFVTKINAAGSALVYSTYLGGSADDTGLAIAVDNVGGAYLTGSTTSANFPTTTGAFDTTCGATGACNGLSDAFVAKIADVADLAITKTGTPNPVNVGSTLTYTLTITNNGPAIATGVLVADTLPAGLTFVSATASQGTCTGTSALSCNLGSLAVAASATVTIAVMPTAAGTLTNTATVASDQFDPIPANNTTTASTTVSAATSTPTPTATATTTPLPTSTATATPTIVPPICTPRPQVGVAATPNGAGGLLATITANTLPGSPTNPVLQLQFGAATNALIDIPGGPIAQSGNFTVTLPAGTTQAFFTVRRATTGQAVTVPLTVVDGCGAWPTFVGGGPTAF